MTPPAVVVYAVSRAFRTACAGLLRDAGAGGRVASRQSELVKALSEGAILVIIAGDDGQDIAVARELAATSATVRHVLQRASGESIAQIVTRALAVVATAIDRPPASE